MKTIHRCKIQSMDHTGDSTIATYDPDIKESVKVAQDELTAFLDKCVADHGEAPPVWARRTLGNGDYQAFDPRSDDLTDVEEVVTHAPLVGG